MRMGSLWSGALTRNARHRDWQCGRNEGFQPRDGLTFLGLGADRAFFAAFLIQLGDKPIAERVNSLDVFRRFGIVTQKLTELANLSRQRILCYIRSTPDCVE